LSRALEETGHLGIAKLTMHNREYTVILRPHEGGIMLHTMYYENEVRRIENFGKTDVDIKEAEVKVAHQLIEALSADFEPEKYHDTFEDNLKELIKAHLEGKEVTPVAKPAKLAPVTDLMSALKQSLASMEGKKKGPQRVSEAEAASRTHVKTPAKKKRPKKAA
jgi:DNA end-binding protein Ku